jgi:hypothetical protein
LDAFFLTFDPASSDNAQRSAREMSKYGEPHETTETDTANSDSVLPGPPEVFHGSFWMRAGAVGLLGVAVAAILSACLISIVHHQKPQGISMGYVGPAAIQAQVAHNAGAAVDLAPYGSREQAIRGIEKLDDYGALIVTPAGTELLLSTSASAPVAFVLRQAFAPLTRQVTDVKPLPTSDTVGGSIPALLEVVVGAGAIAVTDLRRLVPGFKVTKRGGHLPLIFMVGYSLVIGIVTTAVAATFGVGSGTGVLSRVFVLSFVTLAVLAASGALVSLLGVAGAATGALVFFLVGIPSSGAIDPLPMIPGGWKDFGEVLPTGAGATLIRKTFYFHDAPTGHEILALALYVVLGLSVFAAANAYAHVRSRHTAVSVTRLRNPAPASLPVA